MQSRRTAVFWQRTPYDVFAGGDGLYLLQLQRFLASKGWNIIIATTSLDRPRLVLKPFYGNEFKRIVRKAIRIPSGSLVTPYLVLSGIFAYLKRLRANETEHRFTKASASELDWLACQLESLQPSLLIKCFDSSIDGLGKLPIGLPVLHLIGFMNPSSLRIVEGSLMKRENPTLPAIGPVGDRNLPRTNTAYIVGLSSRYEALDVRQRLEIDSLYVGLGFARPSFVSTSNGLTVTFIGNKTSPNRDAVQFLLGSIWPKVLQVIPQAELRIVGRVCVYFNRKHSNVCFVGEVDDLLPEYGRSTLIVAPLRVGSSGVKTKIGEAFSYGRSIVTTSLGVDAADPLQFGGAATIADSPSAIASSIITLLSDPKLRAEAERDAQAIYTSLFSFEAAYGELEEWLASNINNPT